MIATPPTKTPIFKASNLSAEAAFGLVVEVAAAVIDVEVTAATVAEPIGAVELVTPAAFVVDATTLVLDVAVIRVLVGIGSELPPGPV